MSCFDYVDVRGNKIGIPYTEQNYLHQTKELSCDLFVYKFNDANQLVHDLTSSRYSSIKPEELPMLPVPFNGEFEMSSEVSIGVEDGEEALYFLEFTNGLVVKATRYVERWPKSDDNETVLFSNGKVFGI